MKEIPTIKPGQTYIYQDNGLSEITVLEVKGDYIKLNNDIGWVSKNIFKSFARQLLGRWKYFLGIRLWRIE